ncbi:hypothetical protein [Streptomyces sp. NPDC000229]|uniref:hypothetical protein n=1 Tax=Streptomyces sp. NPDC000229 TaxID=3154247 RepID=UPI00331F24C7
MTVIGTPFGAVVTHFFHSRVTERTAAPALAEQLRRERIAAYGAFADAVVEYRQAFEVTHRTREAKDEAKGGAERGRCSEEADGAPAAAAAPSVR